MAKPLSKYAQQVLASLRAGKVYKAYAEDTPTSMQELVDAGLVTTTGRAVVVARCFVPTTGYTPMVPEKFD